MKEREDGECSDWGGKQEVEREHLFVHEIMTFRTGKMFDRVSENQQSDELFGSVLWKIRIKLNGICKASFNLAHWRNKQAVARQTPEVMPDNTSIAQQPQWRCFFADYKPTTMITMMMMMKDRKFASFASAWDAILENWIVVGIIIFLQHFFRFVSKCYGFSLMHSMLSGSHTFDRIECSVFWQDRGDHSVEQKQKQRHGSNNNQRHIPPSKYPYL